ncbi:MAG: DUF4956 domain-containing protein [Bacteroidota bacterium]|nr:DUF4956 domain-containing protein [Bacteroidota bacterium]
MNYDRLINYFNFEPQTIDIRLFIINALICIALTIILEFTYRTCAHSLSNRSRFAYNFVLVSLTTMLIITLIGSSVALSLGLVGALSIIRYRAAIKEPEELSYLFVSVAIGLGMGANQPGVTVAAFLIILGVIWVRHFIKPSNKHVAFNFIVHMDNPEKESMSKIMTTINHHFKKNNLKRYDEEKTMLEMSFDIKPKNPISLESCKQDLQKLNDSIRVSFIDAE